MATTLLVSDSTQTPFTSGSAGLQIVRATATPYAGSPVGAVAGLQGNFVLDSSTDSVWMCTVSGTSGSAQWEQVLTDPNLYALINGSATEAFNVAAATTASGAVNLGQLQNGTESLDITGLTATSAQINGNATITGTATVSGATASGEAVNLNQLFIGNRKAVFTANGTYTVPAGVTQIWVSAAGGGGGGGGGNYLTTTVEGAGGGGGFAGDVVIKTPITVTPGAALTITIGAGGAGGTGTGEVALGTGGTGGTGGTTTLVTGTTTLLSLAGGGGGTGAYVYFTSYVYGGTGFSQGMCLAAYDSSNAVNGNIGYGGVGGGSPLGAGGGGGGGGAGAAGAGGGAGILIVEW
ncbi:MAG: hypothetical protein ACYCS8_04090 [Acidithiobacillus sp.]